MNTAVCKRFFTRFVAAALLATGAGTLAPSALAAPNEAKAQESVVFAKAGQIMYTVSIADYTQTLTSQSCADTLKSAMPKTEAEINPVFKQNEGYNYCSGTATYSAQAGHEFYSLNGNKLTGHNRVEALLVALKPLKVSSINSNVSVHDATVTSASDGVKVNQSGGEGKGYFMQWRNSTHQNSFTATVNDPSSTTSTSGSSSWLAGGSQGGSDGSQGGSGSQSVAPDGAQPSAGATSAAPTPGASGSASGSASASSSAKATDYRATIAGADKSQAAATKQGNSGIVTALWVVGALVVASAAGLGFLLLKRRKQEAAGGDASEA